MPVTPKTNHTAAAEPTDQRDDYPAWRSFCTDLIFAAAFGPLQYARTVASRARWGNQREVRAWLDACARQPGESREDCRERVAERITDLMATWRTWGGGKRRLGLALLNGEVLNQQLRGAFHRARTPLELAQQATGELLNDEERRRRWHETVADACHLLPPIPGSVLERWRASGKLGRSDVPDQMAPRRGLSEDARQEAADAAADLWMGRADVG